MLRKDRLAIYRKNHTVEEGEVIYSDKTLIAENIPCHLSVNVNNASDINGAPYVLSDFKLFFNSNLNIDIRENDFLIITTKHNQEYSLRAGEIKIYDSTTQVRCRQEKIIEG